MREPEREPESDDALLAGAGATLDTAQPWLEGQGRLSSMTALPSIGVGTGRAVVNRRMVNRSASAMVALALSLLSSGCSEPGHLPVDGQRSSQEASLPPGWQTRMVGDITVALPEGWGSAVMDQGGVDFQGIDVPADLELEIEQILSSAGVEGMLIDEDTVVESERADALAGIILSLVELGEPESSDDLVSVLKEMAGDFDALSAAAFEVIEHPSVPAAVAKASVAQDGVDYNFHVYLLGFTPKAVLAAVGTSTLQAESAMAEAEEILRTVRLG